MKDAASLPLAFGGMGLRSAVPACWASWGDALSMISQRHRAVQSCAKCLATARQPTSMLQHVRQINSEV